MLFCKLNCVSVKSTMLKQIVDRANGTAEGANDANDDINADGDNINLIVPFLTTKILSAEVFDVNEYAKKYDSGSQTVAAMCYFNGIHIEKCHVKALQYAKNAIKLNTNNSMAFVVLSRLYLHGNNITHNGVLSYYYAERAINACPTNEQAIYNIVQHKIDGIGCEINYKHAYEYNALLLELDSDNVRALNMIGWLLQNGKGCVKNTIKAKEYLTRAYEINPNNVFANLQLGNILLLQRNKRCLDYYNRVIELKPDNVLANTQIGYAYHTGFFNLPVDGKIAFEHYTRALSNSNNTGTLIRILDLHISRIYVLDPAVALGYAIRLGHKYQMRHCLKEAVDNCTNPAVLNLLIKLDLKLNKLPPLLVACIDQIKRNISQIELQFEYAEGGSGYMLAKERFTRQISEGTTDAARVSDATDASK